MDLVTVIDIQLVCEPDFVS